MIQQKTFAKWLLFLTTACLFIPFLMYIATGSLWQSPILERFLLACFPFFRFLRPWPLALLFIFSQLACFQIIAQITPHTFTFWIGIGFILLAILYVLLSSFICIGYFLGGTLLLFHDNTLQFKRINFFDDSLEQQI